MYYVCLEEYSHDQQLYLLFVTEKHFFDEWVEQVDLLQVTMQSRRTNVNTENRICLSGDTVGDGEWRAGRGGVDKIIVVFLRWREREGEVGGEVNKFVLACLSWISLSWSIGYDDAFAWIWEERPIPLILNSSRYMEFSLDALHFHLEYTYLPVDDHDFDSFWTNCEYQKEFHWEMESIVELKTINIVCSSNLYSLTVCNLFYSKYGLFV